MHHALHVSTEETVVKSCGKKNVTSCEKKALNFVILAFLFKASLSFSKADMLINNSQRDHGDDTDALLNETLERPAQSFLYT